MHTFCTVCPFTVFASLTRLVIQRSWFEPRAGIVHVGLIKQVQSIRVFFGRMPFVCFDRGFQSYLIGYPGTYRNLNAFKT